jgi:oligopeptide/dipeptide ABC transporter ATP-binding protein
MVGIVGESGSGKSLTALAVAGLLPPTARASAQRMALFGEDVEALDERERSALLGTSLAMVFQDPMSSLNPALRVGRQVGEVAEVHLGQTRQQAERSAVERMREVRIAAAEVRARQYPHQFSGGMRQRAMIAMGLVATPRLLVADEPTTALDVTVQREVLRLLRGVRDRSGTAVLLISHDIAVVAELCGRVVVMYAGLVVEDGPVQEVLRRPAHPYTRALLDAIPDMDTARDDALATIPGRPPAPADRPSGCPFAPRCPRAQDTCAERLPPLLPVAGTRAACWFPHDEERAHVSAGSREVA